MKLFLLDRCVSTNILAEEYAREHPDTVALFISGSQSGGVGRLGRSFSSSEGGLYMSLLLPGEGRALSDTVGFTAYCALRCAEALEQLCSVPVGIKWVNDLYLRGRKLGGIITHGSLSPDGRTLSHMTVGIGINIRNQLPPELADVAISLKEAGAPMPSREELGREIASRIVNGRAEFLSDSVLQGYRERMLLLGKRVTVYSAEREFFATVLGVNPDYSLKILAADGAVRDLYSGEISVREDSSTNIPVFKK